MGEPDAKSEVEEEATEATPPEIVVNGLPKPTLAVNTQPG